MKFRRQPFSFFLLFFLSVAVLLGCNSLLQNQQEAPQNSLSVSQADPPQLLVSAAASLSDAMAALQPLYTQQNPETQLVYNFGSSGSLQQQIEQGAPVDVFISAAPKQMDALEQKGLLFPGSRKNLLTNSMVLIVPKGQKTITRFQDLTNSAVRRIAIGEPESVPAGKYAKEVLTSLNLFDALQSKLIYAKDVRQVLNYVETGNVDAGIVYQTDAKISTKVDILATAPTASHSPIVYPIAVIKESKNPEIAKAFITFISDNTAKTAFEQFGFRRAS
jgi:molybdate transport system substrate-binding protein